MSTLEYKKLTFLLKKAQIGDFEAFQEIYNMTSQAQYFHIYQIVGDSHEAQDVLQETYLLLYQNLQKINPPSALLAYLNRLSYYISKNTAKYQARRHHRTTDIHQAEEVADANDTPLNYVELSDNVRVIRDAVSSLPERERLVVSMRYYQRLPMQQIASSMGLSLSTVKRLHQSAKSLLKLNLKKEGLLACLGLSPRLYLALEKGAAASELPALGDIISKTSAFTGDVPSCPSGAGVGKGASAAVKTAAAAAGASGVILAGVHVLPSPGVEGIKIPESQQGAPVPVEFRVSGALGVKSAILKDENGDSIRAEDLSDRRFRAIVHKNGYYRIVINVSNGKKTEKAVRVDCIDTTPPAAVDLAMDGGRVTITFEEDGSGVDFDSVYCVSTSGILTRPESYDEERMTAVFRLTEEDNVLYFADKAGNMGRAPVSLEIVD